MDLLGEHLAERATEHGEVLCVHEHLAAVDGAPTRDDAVGVGTLVQASGMGTVAGEEVEFLERGGVEEVLDALSREHLALLVLALDRPGGTGVIRLLPALAEVVQLLVHRIRVRHVKRG
uniref:Unannotated protein n=1 Tax=freshwater metagenome TaxID=449393 RepID=A0A6J7NCL4_9ZZZZ